jgi:multidrug resistance efflux pump
MHERRSFRRVFEPSMRRVMSRIPAGLVIAAAIGGAWCLLRLERADSAALKPGACLHVVASKSDGRIAWVIDATTSRVQVGDVLATMDNADDGAALRAPVGGAVRAVLRHAGEYVATGDPVVIVGPISGTACP